MVLHEDAAPITKVLSSNMILSSSLLSQGNDKITQLLHGSYIKHKKSDSDDHTPLWSALLKDFEELMENDAPSRGPWRFLLLFSMVDEEVRCVEYGLPSYGAVQACCSECLADRGGRPWTDLRRCSKWRGTEFFTLEQYVHRLRRPLHPLAASKFVWRFFWFLDAMHLLDCKGVTSSMAGSLLILLVRDVRLGPNQQSRMDLINIKLRGFYSRNKDAYKLPKLKLQNLTRADGWAEMSGPAIKAAQTKACAPFLRELADEYFDTDTFEDLAIRTLFSCLEKFYNLMASCGMFPNDAELMQMQDTIDDWGIALQRLRCEAHARDQLLWQIRPKCHRVLHLPFFAAVVNPNSLNCYIRESQVGTSQKVWKASVKGRYRLVAQRTVLARRWLGLLLRLEMAP